MRVALSLAAVLLAAVGLLVAAVDTADAGCGRWKRCGGAVLVPAPIPIPMPAPVFVAPAPAPCGGGCGGGGYAYASPAYYAYYVQPAYGVCNTGPGSCYWRRNCWYDTFGRRFCN